MKKNSSEKQKKKLYVFEEKRTCPYCHGRGYTEHYETLQGADRGMFVGMDSNGRYTLTCSKCNGRGYQVKIWG